MKHRASFADNLRCFGVIATLAIGCVLAAPASAGCSPAAAMHDQLKLLKRDKWQSVQDAVRQTMSIDLLDCLGAPDPVLRDELTFEALSAWMRGKQLTPETLRTINGKLQAVLSESKSAAGGFADAAGFLQPFAALTLAEIARADRIQAFLTDKELDGLVDTAANYLINVRDYRGYVEGEGWRHGVAHGADLMLQLSLNPRLTRSHLDRILAAIASQIAPPGEHFYRYHEGERLMAPVFYIAKRSVYDAKDWEGWISSLMQPTEAKPTVSQATLARRHNLSGFLLPLYFSLRESGDTQQQERLLPATTKALKALD